VRGATGLPRRRVSISGGALVRGLVDGDFGSYPAAMTGMRAAGTLGDLLASRRRRRFVGRAAEIELFRGALDSAEPPFSMLHIHGPAGIGKTSLLDVFAGLAAHAGANVVRLDGRDLLASPPAVVEALRGVLPVPGAEGAIGGGAGHGPVGAAARTYERLAPLDDWLRTRLLPRLPATALAVVAGRMPPSPAWRADPAWRELLRVVSLRNLSPQESRQYLHACGVDPARHDQLVEVAHGHPLGLSLLADVVARGGEAAADPLTPDLVGTLLRWFVEVVPSGLHRRALEVCALARVTTEALLREVLGLEDAHELFAWLRGLSFVESGPDGVFPHDLARDALDADLRWRDPEAYKWVFRGIRACIHGRLQSSQGHEQQRAIWFGGSSVHRKVIDRLVRYGSGFHPLGQPGDAELRRLADALTTAGRAPGDLEYVGGVRGRFPGPDGTADLGEALLLSRGRSRAASAPSASSPGQFTDDTARIAGFCQDLVARAAALGGPAGPPADG
jgi:energy-coupling factor transporter ATP-binding protein EcfA2